MDRLRNETSPLLEVLLQKLAAVQLSTSPAKRQCPTDFIAMAGQFMRNVAPMRVALDCKLSEERSPLQLGRFDQLPWLLSDPWADNLLLIAATRFKHVKNSLQVIKFIS